MITAVITFGRSSAGARVVRMAMRGAVATAPRPAANITAITPIAGRSRPSRSSGAETQRMPAVASRIGGTRRESGIAARLPITEPAPNAPNMSPAVRALAP